MLSGGPDSALALVEALRQTSEPVVALHVVLVANSNRHEYETAACKRIVDYCRKNYRDFEYTTGKVVPPKMARYSDFPILGSMVGMVCNGYGDVRKIWAGMDESAGSGVDQAFDQVMRGSIFAERHPGTNIPTEFYPMPWELKNKQFVREQLGEELWNLTWSCRHPQIGGVECGKCHSCENRMKTHAPT